MISTSGCGSFSFLQLLKEELLSANGMTMEIEKVEPVNKAVIEGKKRNYFSCYYQFSIITDKSPKVPCLLSVAVTSVDTKRTIYISFR